MSGEAKLNASQLDRLLAAESACKAARAKGETEEQAKDAARRAADAKREEQFRRRFPFLVPTPQKAG